MKFGVHRMFLPSFRKSAAAFCMGIAARSGLARCGPAQRGNITGFRAGFRTIADIKPQNFRVKPPHCGSGDLKGQ